jgi:serine/threonine-protein kinase
MTKEDWREVEHVFHSVREFGVEERLRWFNQQGVPDHVRREVESLLAAERTSGVLDGAPPCLALDEPPLIGESLGAYRVEREISSGGMATVYSAVRADGQFDKRVAVKVVRPEVAGSSEFRQRFLAERQILAGLEHPYIARMLDGGTTPQGRPFLVLEFVDGVPVHEYCSARQLNSAACVALFRRICAAVSYAHRHLVVHRDLKPANILVLEDGTPKLLDFGIAKLLLPGRENLPTRRWLTPEFASPEQIRQAAITTASDVYSLGLLLYLLLTGRHPYSGLEGYDLMTAMVERDAPPAGAGQDLDAILAQALQRDPAARYSSVEALDADLARWQQRLPVRATAGGLGYQTRKFLQRNWLPVCAAAAVLMALIVGGGAALVQARSAQHERARTEKINHYLRGVLGADSVVTSQVRDNNLKVRELLDDALVQLDRQLRDEPDIALPARKALGGALLSLGEYRKAEPVLRQAYDEARRALGPRHRETREIAVALGACRIYVGDYAGAQTLLIETVPDWAAERPVSTAQTVGLSTLGLSYLMPGQPREGLPWLERAVELQRSAGISDWSYLLALTNLGQARQMLGDRAAKQDLLEVYQRAPLLPPNQLFIYSLLALGTEYQYDGDFAAARRVLEQAIPLATARYGEPHPQTAHPLADLAVVLASEGRFAEARIAGARALENQRSLAPDHPELARTLAQLGRVELLAGDAAAAEKLLRRALEIRRRRLAPGARLTGATAGFLADALRALGRLDEARPLAAEALQVTRNFFPVHHPESVRCAKRVLSLK